MKNFKNGNKIKINDCGGFYTTYDDFFDLVADGIFKDYKNNYAYNEDTYAENINQFFTIMGSAKHNSMTAWIYIIKGEDDKIYLYALEDYEDTIEIID